MKLILESWRGYVEEQKLEELSGSDPITYGQFKSLLNLFRKAKEGLTGDALASTTSIGKFFGSKEAGQLVDMVSGLFAEEKKQDDKEVLQEVDPVTLGTVWAVGKAVAPLAIGLGKLGVKLYKKYKNEPTDATDKAPFLDLFNVDPKYSAILDDRIEEEFVKYWLGKLEQKPDNEVMAVNDLDVNLQLQSFIRDKYERGISGHTAPGLSVQTGDQLAKAKKKVQAKRLGGSIKKIATAD